MKQLGRKKENNGKKETGKEEEGKDEEEKDERKREIKRRKLEETIETIKIGQEELPEAHKAERRVQFSEETEKILEERGKAAREKNTEELNKKSKEFRKSKKNDKREAILKAINKDMDERERWMGLRNMKKGYQPQPYHRTEKGTGEHIHMKEEHKKPRNT